MPGPEPVDTEYVSAYVSDWENIEEAAALASEKDNEAAYNLEADAND